MTSTSTNDTLCQSDDNICIVREFQLEIIIVPTVLLGLTLICLLIICSLLYCCNQERTRASHRYHSSKHRHTQAHHRTHQHHNTHPQHQNTHPNQHNTHPHHNKHAQHQNTQPHQHSTHAHHQNTHHQNTHAHHQNTHHQNTHAHHQNTHHQNTHAHHQNNHAHHQNTHAHHQNTHAHHQNNHAHHQNTHAHHQNTHAHHQNTRTHHNTRKHNQRQHLRGIDAPPGINPLEHEELPMTVQTRRPTEAAVPQTSTERPLGDFSQVIALPSSFSIQPSDTVNLYRARMNNRDVILRMLKVTASSSEKQHFLDFASFLSRLGPHPFVPAVLGVVSVQPPLALVVEEMKHRDLLGFLWECRQDNSSIDMTEKRIFIMAGQVASALDYLHSQSCIHGNVAARSVLVGADLTAKLWGLGSAYRRSQASSGGAVEDMELRKWQAPEVLAGRSVSQSSDVWSFGILIYEMVTLGDPPFANITATELLQYLQRGKYLKRPTTCSESLYSIIRSCCHWTPQRRTSLTELIRTLQAGERSANGRTVLRVTEPFNFDRYKREAGIGEAYNHAVF
ncbi:tyrosine-protein kinase STYK1 [Kryptolebias marmoratus]|uniref:Tyrosine-protein kinase STYK1-like n=1 Tax=Kryptolebias marmoratus TaxID=37003 RepID=A0A3Q3GQP3_KRYMA|nr:tyrosine-protein kinase STYK1 [Kryptolebias marmoratus]